MRAAEPRAFLQIDFQSMRSGTAPAFPSAEVILHIAVHGAASMAGAVHCASQRQSFLGEVQRDVCPDGITRRTIRREEGDFTEAHLRFGAVKADARGGDR